MNIDISIPWKDGDGTISIKGDNSRITITSQDRNSTTGCQRLIFTTTSGNKDEDFSVLDVWYINGLIGYTHSEYIYNMQTTEDENLKITEDDNFRFIQNEWQKTNP